MKIRSYEEMIHVDRNKDNVVLMGTLHELLNDFMNIVESLYPVMEKYLGEKLARRMLSDVSEMAISEKTEDMLKIVTPAEKK